MTDNRKFASRVLLDAADSLEREPSFYEEEPDDYRYGLDTGIKHCVDTLRVRAAWVLRTQGYAGRDETT